MSTRDNERKLRREHERRKAQYKEKEASIALAKGGALFANRARGIADYNDLTTPLASQWAREKGLLKGHEAATARQLTSTTPMLRRRVGTTHVTFDCHKK